MVESFEYFDLVESQNYFRTQKFIVSNSEFLIKSLYAFASLALSAVTFCNTMTRHNPVGVICKLSRSVSGGEDGLKFIRCVGGRELHGSVERLGVPAPSCGNGVAWTEDILVPDSCWGDCCSCESSDSTTFYRPCFGGRSAPWRGTVPFRPNNLLISPEKARPVLYVRLRERRLALAQALLRDLHLDGDKRGNGLDDSLDGWNYEQ